MSKNTIRQDAIAQKHGQAVAKKFREQGITIDQLTPDMLIAALTPEMLIEAAFAALQDMTPEDWEAYLPTYLHAL